MILDAVPGTTVEDGEEALLKVSGIFEPKQT
jgi:hypothetical protein